ncbi:hypothetical protein F5890DRAFT_1529803 [Lentinula detonsa]|uniref:Uncharacterized protein n=1 Tax=Lentinula detonsa TaxID=2804962 RepID=A0AA38PVE4_9AGAR|nr:hypothetical protein F5890DRAFT_1529803 [Lentinula detonsa]
MSHQHHLEDQSHANVWLGNPSSVPAYPAVLSHPQPHYENQPSVPAATMIPIPVADPAVLLSDQQQEPVTNTPHSEGKQKKPNTKAPRRRPPPIGKNLRVIKSKTSPSLEIYQFEWQAEVANVDQGSTSFTHETMEQQTGSQNHFHAVQPEIQQNTNWLSEQFQYPVQDWNVLDPQSQQSLSQSPQVWHQTQHMYPLITQGEQPQGMLPQDLVQPQNQFIADDQHQAAQFAYSAQGYQLKQTAKRWGHTRIMAAYQRYLAQRAVHPSQQISIPAQPTDSWVHPQRYHPYQHSSMSPTIYQAPRPPTHQDQMSSGMNVLLPPLAHCQPSYQSSGTSSSSSCHASASASMTPVWNEKYSPSPNHCGTTFDAQNFQIPPAQHRWDQFQAQSLEAHQQQHDLRGLGYATSELACDSYHSQAIQHSTAKETVNVEDRNGQAFDNENVGDDGSLFGDDNDGRGLALPGITNVQVNLLHNQLALPGSTNTTVLIPAANDSICADGVVKDDFLFAAESSEPPAPIAPVPQAIPRTAYTAPVAEDFDLEAELQKAYDSLSSPSASPAVLPASNPVRGDKGKSRKRDSAKKTTQIEFQSNDDPILDRFSRAILQFQDPHSAWVHSSAVSFEPPKQSRQCKLVKIPDCPPGVVCCLPPLQYTHNEQGQVVNVIEEVTTETTSICSKRKICSFAIDTATPSDVELHFYFHRVATENSMRAAHAAGVPSAYQCMWHYDERDKTEFQMQARGFRRGILCHEVSFSDNTFNTYNDLAQHWNIHAAHKLLRRFCPIPKCMEVVSSEGGIRLAEHLRQCHRGYIFESYCL